MGTGFRPPPEVGVLCFRVAPRLSGTGRDRGGGCVSARRRWGALIPAAPAVPARVSGARPGGRVRRRAPLCGLGGSGAPGAPRGAMPLTGRSFCSQGDTMSSAGRRRGRPNRGGGRGRGRGGGGRGGAGRGQSSKSHAGGFKKGSSRMWDEEDDFCLFEEQRTAPRS